MPQEEFYCSWLGMQFTCARGKGSSAAAVDFLSICCSIGVSSWPVESGCLWIRRCPHSEIHGPSWRGDYHSPHCGTGEEREGGERERGRQGETIGEGVIT